MFNWLFKKVVTFREKVAVDLGQGDDEKPFLDHLEDLRSMIVRMAVTLLLVTLVTFFFINELMGIITYPLVLAGIADSVQLQNFKVTGGFMTAMNISLVAGVIVSFPVLLYFLLQFVLPGLRNNEKKVIFPALGVGGGLFLIGVVFAYFVVTPRALTFFYEFSRDIGNTSHVNVQGSTAQSSQSGASVIPDLKPGTRITATTGDGKTVVFEVVEVRAPATEPGKEGATTPGSAVAAAAPATDAVAVAKPPAPFIWELTEYVKFICQFILIFGACFELPVVVMALVKLDVLNYKVMKGSRSWAAIIIAIAAAVITPTQDAMTLALLAVPMYILYEICIWLAWWLEKRDRQLYPEYYKEQDEDEKSLDVSDEWDNENYNPWGGGDDGEEDDDEGPSSKPKPKPAAPAGESKPDAEAKPETNSPTSSLSTTTPAGDGSGEGKAVSDTSYSPPESSLSSDGPGEAAPASEPAPAPEADHELAQDQDQGGKDSGESSTEDDDWSLKKDKPNDGPTADKRDTD
jgi:Sec-independent protein secretion pathway component TatC